MLRVRLPVPFGVPHPVFGLLLVLVLLGGCVGATPQPAEPGHAVVRRVVDGDTVEVRIGEVDETVRLLGIDTPESVDPRSPVECFGREAAEHLASLLPPGTDVRLVRDVEGRDRYDRLLAYVYRQQDAMFVNLALVREGYAAVLTYPPNVAHADEFTVAAAEARVDARGLWGACRGE